MTEPQPTPDDEHREPTHADAAAVGWHGHADDYDDRSQVWRPVHDVVVRGDRL